MQIDRNNDIQEQNTLPDREPGKCDYKENTSDNKRFTEVENAHAAGLGSMGRSDEKLNDKDNSFGKNEKAY